MIMPKPINQEEIDAIKAKFDALIAAEPDHKLFYQIQCEEEVANAIGRQRKEALEAGGELAEKIMAENEAMRREADAFLASISENEMKELIEEQTKRKHELNELLFSPGFCSECGFKLAPGSKFCPSCGAKLNS